MALGVVHGTMAALELEDGHLWYDETGGGPPLVCLHGGWMDGDAWQPQAARFADEFRVIRPDFRGHGRTGPTDRRRYSIDLFVDDVERLLSHLGADRPVLCGLSLGAMVVQSYLDRHPEGATAAILGGPLRSMPPLDLPAWLKRCGAPESGIRTSLAVAGSKTTYRSLLASIRTAQGGPWLSTDRDTRSRAVEAAGEMPRSEFRKVFDALYRFDPPDLSGVAVPTLAVYGRDEAPLVKRQGRQIVGAVERGRAAAVPDAAHLVNVDNPRAFNEVVADFLRERTPADAGGHR